MRDTSKNYMVTGNLWSGMLLFSLPLMASNLLQVLFNMADVAVIGRFGGTLSLGSVGSTTTLILVFTSLLIGLGSGINVLTAQQLGAGHTQDIHRTVHTSALTALLYGVLLCLFGEAVSAPILRLIGTKDVLFDGAVLYFRIYLLGLPALSLYNYGNAVYSAAGNTKKPLAILTTAGLLNVVLNLFFVIICKMDVAGVALASVLSQYLSAVLVLFVLTHVHEDWGMKLAELRLHPETMRKVLSLGIPAGIQNAIFAVANLFIQSGVNSWVALGMRSLVIFTFFLSRAKVSSFSSLL